MSVRPSKRITSLVVPPSSFRRPKLDLKQVVSHQAAGVSFNFLIILTHLSALIYSTTVTEMKFSDNPDVGAALGLAAHLIPQVNIGLNALENTASASVYLNFDASLGLQGSASSTKKPQPCLTGKAEINVELGMQGSFFYIFSDSTGKSLFNKTFTLFQVRAHYLLSNFFFFSNIYHFLYMTTALLHRELKFVEFDFSEFEPSKFELAEFEFGYSICSTCLFAIHISRIFVSLPLLGAHYRLEALLCILLLYIHGRALPFFVYPSCVPYIDYTLLKHIPLHVNLNVSLNGYLCEIH